MTKLSKVFKLAALCICFILLNACTMPVTTPKHKVTFLDDLGEEIATVYVQEGAEVEEPDPSKEGYTFTGWDQDITNITEDITVRATYKINVYKVTFMVDDEIVEVQEVEYNKSATAPKVEKEGYRFQKWNQDYTEVKSDLVVKAEFAKKQYLVRFLNASGEVIDTQFVNYEEAAVEPTDYEVERYRFIKWDQDFSSVTGEMTIRGIYEKETAIIKFFNGKKTILEDYNRTEWDEYTLPIPSLDGYYFAGWYLSDKSLTEYKSISEGDTNDYSFYARFVEIEAHDNTKIVLPPATYRFTNIKKVSESGVTLLQPEMPAGVPGTVTDYDWSTSNEAIASVSVWSSITAKQTGYTVLTATYKNNKSITINCIIKSSTDGVQVATEDEANKREVVTVTFRGKDGEIICEKKTLVGSNVVYPVPPKYDGYKFVGWGLKNYDIREDTEIRAYYENGTNKYAGKTISILGDSISTYGGYIPDGYRMFYPYAAGDVRDVNQTWWMQVINNLGATLLSNNSYSGSCVAGGGDSAAANINRLKTLKMQDVAPDVIIVYMGTNDCGSQYISLKDFDAAYDIMLKRMQEMCPNSEIILCTLPISKFCPTELRMQYNGVIIEKATKYGVTLIDLSNVDLTNHLIDSVHPKCSGMDIMAAKIVNEMLKNK